MQKNIIAREKECEALRECLEATSSQLVVIYGRRRVGKTFLVNQFFDDAFAFKVTGIYDKPKDVQLQAFTASLNNYFDVQLDTPGKWLDAFNLLRRNLEAASTPGKKMVLFFDEMPWLDTQKSDFLPAFEWFWNDWGCAQDNVVCIVCGSATSWMSSHIDHNKGGLFNRQNCRIYLEPFNLAETRQFLLSKNIEWSPYDIAECYMIMGGIPFYLSLLSDKLSLSQNIDNLFFRKHGLLWDEFDHLYHTLFSDSEVYIRIVELLSTKGIGFSRTEISDGAKIPANGRLTAILDNLVYSGFVRAYPFYGNKKKQLLYQLCDYYTLFYYKFVKDNYGHDESFWSNSYDNPAIRAWRGFTFEQLCKDHVYQIKRKLGISGVLSNESAWFVRAGEEGEGAQIDMLIDRRDHVVNVCEMKFSADEFTIDKDYEQKLRRKVSRFVEVTGTRKSVQLTMITSYGVRKNMYSGRVTNQVLLEDLFGPHP
ncbi:MAG: AAA family ATPase [Treponema sp.]|nr:AAA family ATPase [Treponema sp.]